MNLIAVVAFAAPDNQAGFFRTKNESGRWWLVAPDGQRFISKGVDNIQFSPDQIQGTNSSPYRDTNGKKYGTADAWRIATVRRLIDWGFNTLGAWSDPAISRANPDGKRLAYAPILDIGSSFVGMKQKDQAWQHGVFPDVFDPDFEKFAYQRAKELASPRKDDHWLLGWFTDNELRWGPDWRGSDELLTMFLAKPPDEPGRKAAVDLLRQRYQDFSKFNEVWNTAFHSWDELAAGGPVKPPVVRKAIYAQNQEVERKQNEADPKRAAFVADCEAFLAKLADRYFKVTAGALKSADPNHMNFGCRFAYVPPEPVIVADAKHLDVISFNCYATDPRDIIQRYSAFKKPLIIGEFAFRGEDSGLPNSRGAGPTVRTQTDRAAAFETYVTQALGNPNLVGYHWFEFCDEPKEGRFDGENSNYGLVNIKDEVYEELTNTMTRVNQGAEKLHAE